jgi:pilus assembly protein CpaB
MNTRRKPFIILGASTFIALAVAVFTYQWLQEKSFAVHNLETQPVTVAKTDLPWATVLTKDKVKTAPFLRKSLAGGYFPDPSGLEGRTLLYPVKAGEPILESKLTPIAVKGGGVAAVITPQRRAMAVKVDKVVGVAGFIHPGNRVDVLVTFHHSSKVPVPVTKTVLENVLVLTVGPEIEASAKQEKPAPVDVITLEVTPQEGEKLALAATEGKLQLALRNYSDAEGVTTKGTTISTLLAAHTEAGEKRVRKPSPAPPARQKHAFSVELIKGNKTSETKFQ